MPAMAQLMLASWAFSPSGEFLAYAVLMKCYKKETAGRCIHVNICIRNNVYRESVKVDRLCVGDGKVPQLEVSDWGSIAAVNLFAEKFLVYATDPFLRNVYTRYDHKCTPVTKVMFSKTRRMQIAVFGPCWEPFSIIAGLPSEGSFRESDASLSDFSSSRSEVPGFRVDRSARLLLRTGASWARLRAVLGALGVRETVPLLRRAARLCFSRGKNKSNISTSPT